MGFKKLFPLNQIITNGVMSSTNTITSTTIPIQNGDNFGLQIGWTGTPTGTISVQCSNDGVTYSALTFAPGLAQPAGSSGNYLISLNQLPWGFLQVQYVNASGSGVLNVYSIGKDVN